MIDDLEFIVSDSDKHLLNGPEVHVDLTAAGDTVTLAAQLKHWLPEPQHPESVEILADLGHGTLELSPEKALELAPLFAAFGEQLADLAEQAIAFRASLGRVIQ